MNTRLRAGGSNVRASPVSSGHEAGVSAVILAGGLGTRLRPVIGDLPKPLLPWGAGTVVEQVVTTLLAAGIGDVLVITGHRREAIEAALAPYPVRCILNPAYAGGEMLSSLQAGLRAVPASQVKEFSPVAGISHSPKAVSPVG